MAPGESFGLRIMGAAASVHLENDC